jgi:REP element-mobilizing transposase RayT
MSNTQTVGKILQLIKGESSYWINKNQLCQEKFEWQDEYFAGSVSELTIDRVRQYIIKQEKHHEPNLFEYEYHRWIDQHGFQNDME